MLLKSLELKGFKTFPDKTVLSFNKGITSVVGPNGSGKSNISDAIRWVLGEQSIKTLRCSKMEDVIFGGTALRKARGFAEVTLMADNEDRKLPFDNDEVSITRRYYRSGESEYLINNAVVRLKDIHELFMDTGLGRDGYSIISQGKIDSVISSKSEDRHEIFEEAAGISRFRYRKLEAERKLKQSEENLLRLKDIVTELETRIEPLKDQAAKAKNYLEYSEEKRSLEIGLWLNTLEKSAGVLKDQEDKICVSKNQHDSEMENLEGIRNKMEEVFHKINSYTANVDEIRREISTFEEDAIKKEGEISVLNNDISHNIENINRLKNEIETFNKSSLNMDEDIENKNLEIDKLKETVDKKKIELEKAKEDIDKLNDGLDKSSENVEKLSKQLSELSMNLSDAKVLMVTSESSIAEIKSRIGSLDINIDSQKVYIKDSKKELEDYLKMNEEISENINSSMNTIKGYELQLNTKKNKRDEIKKVADKLTLDSEENIRKVRLLEELERNLEGFNHSVKSIIKESQRGILSGIHGPVSRLIKVPAEYAVAIEVALGASMQNIVVGNEEDAKRAIAYLKKMNNGRATFLPLTTIKGNEIDISELNDCIGYIGVASKLCSCNDKYSGVLRSLLGRIIVVDDLDNAVIIAKRFSYKYRIVTLDGQVINAGGSLTGGSLSRNVGLISRTAEIEKIGKVAEKLKEEAKQARLELREAEAEVSSIEAALLGNKADLSKVQEDKIRLDAECRRVSSEIENSKKSLNNLENEKVDLLNRIEKLKSTKNSANENLEILSNKVCSIEEEIKNTTGNKEELSLQREELLSTIHTSRLEILSSEKDINSLLSEINLIKNRKIDQESKCKNLNIEIENVNNQNNDLTLKIESLKDQIKECRDKSKESKEKIELLAVERSELEKQSVLLRKQERDKSSELEVLSREIARLEERKISLQKEYDLIISKLWEEYELTRREAEEIAVKIEDIQKAQKRLNELKNKIKNLGSVNVAAIEEYKEVSERYEFLSSQLNDVESSKIELSKLINDLSKQMKEMFLARFNLINNNFGIIFKELFGGGNAFLTMSDPEDVLNSGIDITVHPPGKIVSHLEALSGGEKALVAIALYFAIMKVNPSPFCVLDEIEAALDDVNVDRFASYLRKMNDNTQFIVITHRRGTMEEADVLYGVTMQEEGISKLLSLKAYEIEQKLNIK